MQFILEILDRKGAVLAEGDIVKISDGRLFSFYSEVKFLKDEMAIAPFHTFSFHSVEKVDTLPANAVQCTEERYKVWYVPHHEKEEDRDAGIYEKYFRSWRQCEYALEKRAWHITKIQQSKKLKK